MVARQSQKDFLKIVINAWVRFKKHTPNHFNTMNKLKLFLVSLMLILSISSEAQTKNMSQDREYYMYSLVQVRWANKANGEPCFVILMSSGEGTQQKSSILKNENGKTIVFKNQMDGLNYLTLKGWELFESQGKTSRWVARKKVTQDFLSQSVNANTFYIDETPKVQLDMAEQHAHITYE